MERREDEQTTDRVPPAGAAPRKSYVPPSLRIYGSVAALTRTIGKKSKKVDGGSGNKSKTG